jgi:hypothetical protein
MESSGRHSREVRVGERRRRASAPRTRPSPARRKSRCKPVGVPVGLVGRTSLVNTVSPREIREVRIVFDVSDDLSVKSADPEEGGEVARSSDVQPWTTTHGSSTRAEAPSEDEIRDRSPVERPSPPVVQLFCRGPFQLLEVPYVPRVEGHEYGWPAFGFRFVSRHNGTSAGPDGKDLAPGTCALSNRPLRSDEPTETVVLATPYEEFVEPSYGAILPDNPQNARTLAEHERRLFAKKIYEFAQVESALSHLSNLLTRSDYVVMLMAHRHDSSYVTEGGSDGYEGVPKFTPFPE